MKWSEDFINQIVAGDALEVLRQMPDESIHCCVTSPPYWGLRDYGVEGQLGLEKTPDEYVIKMIAVFCEVRRVLRNDGTLWLNLGDSYARNPKKGGSGTPNGRNNRGENYTGNKSLGDLKEKDLVGIPWRVAFALQKDGWYLRSDIIWSKPNPMPESITDRPTKAHEYLFLLAKSERYFYDAEAIKEKADPASAARYNYEFSGAPKGATICPDDEKGQRTRPEGIREFDGTRNKRSVWTVNTQSYSEAHFATFPPKLIEPCILAGCPKDGIVLDPFMGAGTTGLVAAKHSRNFVGIELNPEYAKMARRRVSNEIAQGKLF